MVRGGAIVRSAPPRHFLLALCAIAALAPPAQAQDREASVLRIGTSGDYAPFSEAIEDPPGYRGFDISLAEAFARDGGYEIEWVRFRWPELAADLRSGRFDLAMSGITVRPDRSVIGRFSVPVMSSGAVLLYSIDALEDAARNPSESAESGSTAADSLAVFDRPGLRIAVNRGGHLERVARAHFERARIRSIPDNGAVRQALIDADADAIVTDSLEAPGWRRGLTRVAAFGPFTRDRKAYWAAPGRDALSRELDAWLIARELDGTLARFRRSAFGDREHEQTARPLAALLAAIDERLALMPWVAESKRRSGKKIEDLAQEIRVLDASRRSVHDAAKRAGTKPPPAAAVTSFYRAQIGAAKAIQRRTLNGQTQRPAEASDLEELLRPALIRIGDRLAQLIVALQQRAETTLPAGEVERSLRARELDDDSLDEIRRALAAITTNAR